LSDTRLKENQTVVPDAKLSAIFDAIEPKEYDFAPPGSGTNGEALPSERRVGFIANDVQAAISATGWTNIVGNKHLDEEEYLTLDYGRLVTILWGKVRSLEARLAAIGG